MITPDPWTRLQSLTRARIALGRRGASLPTREVLAFGLSHAQARDAVHQPLDVAALACGFHAAGYLTRTVTSQAADRGVYLRRPDWGRRLAEASAQQLQTWPAPPGRLVFVIGDGLSSLATQRHSLPLLEALAAYFPDLHACPVVIATQARVALGDEVGQLLGADMVVVLIGERPGLSSPDSLGIYLTGQPRVGLTDAARNCISNVRPEGLPYAEAARKLAFLIAGARQLGRTGVDLKDDSDERLPGERPEPFLLSAAF
ncbi:MAG: ethanolamine ammonia-lyase [Candidatus Dactylopiibacterium carminicum]|uniref:Ethanolamine ammonia-lyase small subunit n=1 Tax=Candidatus Dactylopiibacterium carminicum TaxID=857335 RepID=A0A272EYL2_9RHOO|nr:ethanolamine ammonia-lyase subunit EutC [Candidatus Dactylopiibacterium carminicum]PAS94710.1 MAG: ethanolamine ammonia-lyase [Candidatus Dactylopiibacterium carminicum]PAS96998.1 MAG: ethanolamine ammonia-lyase [Candidatus Dactylopiibacterium carminicum]